MTLARYEQQFGKGLVRWRAPVQSWRPAILLYAGDFDPSGEDIDRDFQKRCPWFKEVVRVALSADQVREYSLPVNPGKVSDFTVRSVHRPAWRAGASRA